ncbi:unnamed protein product [Phyllotreta striolata]|uniref:Protein Wnt n=1 Tax=Phyllotreta striolata TaxID=444603 RepID=A0A9N9TS06_PHYSR|nr:unnamed protein product [Phyllotreta striolata]
MMANLQRFGVLLVILFLGDFVESIKWLSLQHSHLQWNLSLASHPGRGIRSGTSSPCTIARRRYGFVKQQAKLCRHSVEVMPHVQAAAVLAADTCRTVFRQRRWNCSSIGMAPVLPPDLTRATREQAYVYAISSAALTYTMARACSSGGLHQCTCAAKPAAAPAGGQFQWGGCGDNVQWAVQFARRFIDNVEKHALEKRSNGAAANLHNNRVGRKVMVESLRTQCKCHGVSGSCNIKTCWRALPAMAEIGARLLEKYTNAVEVSEGSIAEEVAEERAPKKAKRAVGTQLLVYLSKSPDYCTKDEALGSFGTVGRHCNVSSSGPESCRQLCCGRGYRTVVEEKIERCQCKFYDCCYVKCKICRTKSQIYECL